MEGHSKDDEDVCTKERTASSATSATEENNFSKSKQSSIPGCDGSEFHSDMASLHGQHSTRLRVACSAGPDGEVPSVIVTWQLNSVTEDATEEEDVMKWRQEMDDFPFVFSEFGDSSCDISLSERSSAISSPCTSSTVCSVGQSEDLDGTRIRVSYFNLDNEDTTLFQDNEQDLDIFISDFPGPSFNAMRSHQLGPASYDPDEPIFWPFKNTPYNSPEFDKFLSVSPPRSMMDIGFSAIHQLNPVMLRLHQNNLSAAKRDIEEHRRKTNLGAKGTKVSPDKAQKAAAVPSTLSRATKPSSKHPPSNNCERRRPSHLKIGIPRNGSSPQMTDKPLKELESGDLQNLAGKKVPIEEFIGLHEFDGHERINADAWDFHFSLCLSP